MLSDSVTAGGASHSQPVRAAHRQDVRWDDELRFNFLDTNRHRQKRNKKHQDAKKIVFMCIDDTQRYEDCDSSIRCAECVIPVPILSSHLSLFSLPQSSSARDLCSILLPRSHWQEAKSNCRIYQMLLFVIMHFIQLLWFHNCLFFQPFLHLSYSTWDAVSGTPVWSSIGSTAE